MAGDGHSRRAPLPPFRLTRTNRNVKPRGESVGRRLKIYFDGGCRPNPGPVEVAVVIRGTAHVFTGLADGTNSDAEWCALIHALELSRDHNLGEVDFVGDALEVVRQANHALKTGGGPQPHAARLVALARELPPFRIRWVRRAQNLAGVALAARHPR